MEIPTGRRLYKIVTELNRGMENTLVTPELAIRLRI